MGIREYLDTLGEDERFDIEHSFVKVVDCQEDEDLRPLFPGMAGAGCKITSKADPQFNCVAYIVGDKKNWWWPSPIGTTNVWPEGLPREETVEAIAALFKLLGYEKCAGEQLEQGFEKVAIYARDDFPTHVACQTSVGLWKSKLGRLPDIRHETLRELESPDANSLEWQASLDYGYNSAGFGKVALIMKKSTGEA
jgi:hypothetical protein